MEEDFESLTLLVEKMMNLDISCVFWSNIMDLLAIVTKNNFLEVSPIDNF